MNSSSFWQHRWHELQLAQHVAYKSFATRSLPTNQDLTWSTVLTSIAALLLVNLLLSMLTRRGRKLVLDTVETILATILVVILISIVLGLPIGTLAAFYGST